MLEEGRRGDGGVEAVDSLKLPRRATGLLGGGGRDFVLAVEVMEARWPSVSSFVSMLVRRIAAMRDSGPSSSDERSIRLATGSWGSGGVFRVGSFGLNSGWSWSISGNIDFECLRWSSSMPRREASIAALSSGSSS